MNPTATPPALALASPSALATAQALVAAARVFARIATALRRAAAALRRPARACDPHVGERAALDGLPAHLLRDIGASPPLLARAAEAMHHRAPERLLAGLY
ncbi:MAG: hypothetical protein U1F58_08225 [Burkholderiales bacterium]